MPVTQQGIDPVRELLETGKQVSAQVTVTPEYTLREEQGAGMNSVKSLTWLKGLVAFCCMVSIAAAFQPPTAGLQGVLPEVSPYDISLDEFEILPAEAEAWREWSDKTAFLVADLYEDAELDAAGQAELLSQLEARLAFMEKSLTDPAYKVLFDEFTILHGRVKRRVDLARAALDTLTLDPASITNDLRTSALDDLKKAVSTLTSAMNSRGSAGTGWLAYFKTEDLAGLTIDGENVVDTLTTSKNLFDGRDGFDETQKSFAMKTEFNNVATAVNAALEVWNMPPPEEYNPEALRTELGELIAAVERYEEHNLTADATAVKNYANSFGATALDNGELVKAVLQKHYLNHNVIFQASENFMSKMVSDPQTQSRGISEYISNARVSGSSNTNYNTYVNLRPNANIAEFELQLRGTVSTSTVSVVPDARIGSGGNHSFTATQRITFNGDKLSLYSEPSINVNVNNYTTSINTKADGTIFAETGRNRARQAIAARRGQTDSMTRNKITNEVMPKFRSEVPAKINQVNQDLESKLITKLKEQNLYPVARHTSTTENLLTLANTIMNDLKLGGDTPNIAPEIRDGALLHLHESAANNMLDGLGFAGRTMTEAEIRSEIEAKFSELLGKEFKFSEDTAPPATDEAPAEGETAEEGDEVITADTTFIFDDEDPIRVQFEANKILFIVRAGFRREGKDDLETQIITLPIKFSMKDNNTILLEADTPAVKSESGANVAQSNAIKKRILNSFPPRERERQIQLEREGQSTLTLNVEELSALNGWLKVYVK
ncbi:MAG: hypothetical protein R3C11_10400 [Planctomycetaceae bacterium]